MSGIIYFFVSTIDIPNMISEFSSPEILSKEERKEKELLLQKQKKKEEESLIFHRGNGSNLTTNDLTPYTIRENLQKDQLLIQNEQYLIQYTHHDKSFLISFLVFPTPSFRKEIEKEFMKMLNLTQEEFCQLSIMEYISKDVYDGKYAGQNYGVSFCSHGKDILQ